MTDLVLFEPVLGSSTPPPDYLDFRAPGPGNRFPSIRVFTDTMEKCPRPDQPGFVEFRVGTRVYIEPCAPVPEFPGVYLVAFGAGGLRFARLIPALLGGFELRYDNPTYAADHSYVGPKSNRVQVLGRCRDWA